MRALPRPALSVAACLLLLAPGAARASSVVPSEACVEGAPFQVLTFDELPLEDPQATSMARQAGWVQAEARASIALGFLAGTGATALGLGFAIVGSTTDRPAMARTGLTLTGVGLAVGFSGVFGGRRLMRQAASLADDAIAREVGATGRSVRWRTEEDPCEYE